MQSKADASADSLGEFFVRPGLPRAIEIVVTAIALVVIAPVIALAAVAIIANSRGPVFFRQRRTGRYGRTFVLFKLRTMRIANQGPQVTASGDSRVTGVGKWLRKAKLDELPGLWNVLKGDMALVGPRPEVPAYVNLDNPEWRLALQARPGITDPMTLRLRNEESLLAQVNDDREQFYLRILQPYKLRGYLEYLSRRSWWEDIRILVSTLVAVVSSNGAQALTIKELLADSAGSTNVNDSLA